MSLHLSIPDYQCKKCSAVFIPFRENHPCPQCNAPAESRVNDFIDQVVESMVYHKRKYGSYRPGAWYRGHLSDNIQSVIFDVFDYLEQIKPANGIETIQNVLNKNIDWGEDKYLEKYTEDVALAVYDIYKKGLDNFPISAALEKMLEKNEKTGFFSRLKRFLTIP